MFRDWEDEKQPATQTDKEWPVEVAGKPRDVSLGPREETVSKRRKWSIVSHAADRSSQIRTENRALDLQWGRHCDLDKTDLCSGGSNIQIGMDLREMGGKAWQNVDNCFEKLPAKEQKNWDITGKGNCPEDSPPPFSLKVEETKYVWKLIDMIP